MATPSPAVFGAAGGVEGAARGAHGVPGAPPPRRFSGRWRRSHAIFGNTQLPPSGRVEAQKCWGGCQRRSGSTRSASTSTTTPRPRPAPNFRAGGGAHISHLRKHSTSGREWRPTKYNQTKKCLGRLPAGTDLSQATRMKARALPRMMGSRGPGCAPPGNFRAGGGAHMPS